MATTTGREVWRVYYDEIEHGVVERETEKMIWVKWGDSGWRARQQSKENADLHDSWQAAHAELLRRATEAVEWAEAELRRVMEMVEPLAEQPAAEGER